MSTKTLDISDLKESESAIRSRNVPVLGSAQLGGH